LSHATIYFGVHLWLPGGFLTLIVLGVVVAGIVGGFVLWHPRWWWAEFCFAVLGLASALIGQTVAAAMTLSLAPVSASSHRYGLTAVAVTVIAAALLATALAYPLRFARPPTEQHA
jgi:hypothetical protein